MNGVFFKLNEGFIISFSSAIWCFVYYSPVSGIKKSFMDKIAIEPPNELLVFWSLKFIGKAKGK